MYTQTKPGVQRVVSNKEKKRLDLKDIRKEIGMGKKKAKAERGKASIPPNGKKASKVKAKVKASGKSKANKR